MRVSSSTASAYASVSPPPPPYWRGKGMPIRPSLPSLPTISYGKDFVRSSSSATGATSPSANSRTVLRISSCSLDRSKFIVRTSTTARRGCRGRSLSGCVPLDVKWHEEILVGDVERHRVPQAYRLGCSGDPGDGTPALGP